MILGLVTASLDILVYYNPTPIYTSKNGNILVINGSIRNRKISGFLFFSYRMDL